MALTPRRLFVTVSELWPSLIGSIKTPGALLKTNRRGTRAGDEGGREEGRGGVTVVSLCSTAGGRRVLWGPHNGLTVPVPAVNPLLSEGGIRQEGHKNVMDGVCLTDCVSICLSVSHSL